MISIRNILSVAILAAGAYAAFMIFSQSTLAGGVVAILTLCVAVPLLLAHRRSVQNSRRLHIGEEPSTKMDVGLRQARATVMREEGEIRGAPPAKPGRPTA